MATSIASQLEAIRSVIQTDLEAPKRPITRPSILFDAKEAADIDVDTIFSIALSGLEVLISLDERFRNYRNDLFSDKSRDLNRELMRPEENDRINATISSFLRLLSGHLQLPASHKTLEYLIRRYKIHVYNAEEFILCALPYHDTHAFVRIVQLIDARNSRWKFLEGVKVSGAPLPRNVVVQQCNRDMGVLEALCNYASPTKKYQPSRPVISFCTAVIIEALGSMTVVQSDAVKRILPFLVSGLQPVGKGSSDHKAGALMIVGLLANKVSLDPKLVKSLIRSISEMTREDAKDATDLQWYRLSFMALINLIQLQSIDAFPKKALEFLIETKDVAGALLELSKEFNIDKFLALFLESLVDNSSSGDRSCSTLITIIKTVPVKNLVEHVVARILSFCTRMTQRNDISAPSESGSWVKKILMVINEKYPTEFHHGIRNFMEDSKGRSKKDDTALETLCKMLDGNLDLSISTSYTKNWLALHHPKAEVRRAILSSMKISSIMNNSDFDSPKFVAVRDAILSQLSDDDLIVVQAALSLEGLPDIINASDLLKALDRVLRRFGATQKSRTSDKLTLGVDVVTSILNIAISRYNDQSEYMEEFATMIFPFLLIFPKTQRLNLKILELAKKINWKMYHNLKDISTEEMKLQPEIIASLNAKIISSLARTLTTNPDGFSSWLIKSYKDSNISRTLFFLIMLQLFTSAKNESRDFSAIFDACFPVLKSEWKAFESASDLQNEFNKSMIQWDCKRILDQLADSDINAINTNILVSLFWRLLEAFATVAAPDASLDDNGNCVGNRLRDLFVFFAAAQPKDVFREHLHYLISKCRISPIDFLSGFFTNEDIPVAVQVESLHCFTFLCLEPDDRLLFQLLANFPSLLVPLACDSQDIRIAAMDCIEGLYTLSRRVDYMSKKNGNNTNWGHYLDELLSLFIQHKRVILSDKNYLPSLLASLLGSPCGGLLVPQNIETRFDQSTKQSILSFILGYALKLSEFGKLMIISSLKGLGNTMMRFKDIETYLTQLLERRKQFYFKGDESMKTLSKTEIKILCLLLEICAMSSSSCDGCSFEDHLLKALQLGGLSSEEHVVVEPCITVLQKLTDQLYGHLTNEKQEILFHELVLLYQNGNGSIHNACREALQRLSITPSTVVRTLGFILEQESYEPSSTHGKRKKKSVVHQASNLDYDVFCKRDTMLPFLSSLFDILILKKDMTNREMLIGPLFELLAKLFSNELELSNDEKLIHASGSVHYVSQALLSFMEEVIASFIHSVPPKGDVTNKIDIKLLVKCARISKDGVTCNHIFSLISTIAKVIPGKILDHIVDILMVIGESTVTQIDSYSQQVFEDLISAVIPCWLTKENNAQELLQIFVNILPSVAEHRRLSLVVHLLRTLGELNSLATLLSLLFRSLVARKGLSYLGGAQPLDDLTSSIEREWEYSFSVQICDQYSCMIWLPSVVKLLELIISDGRLSQELFMESLFAMDFTSHKLQGPEFTFNGESSEGSSSIQTSLQALMEHVVTWLQVVDSRRNQISIHDVVRKELKECIDGLLRTTTALMSPVAYFRGIISLLKHSDSNVQKKALGLLSDKLRDHGSMKEKQKGKKLRHVNSSADWLHMDSSSTELLQKVCLEIVKLVDGTEDGVDFSVKLSAVSTVEVLAHAFSSDNSIFTVCLPSITKGISSSNLAVSSGCLRTTGALVNALGPKALTELPRTMKNMIKLYHEVSSSVGEFGTSGVLSASKESLMQSLLVALEAFIDKLGGFLNPYLEDIIRILVLSPEYTTEFKPKLKLKADIVRRLLTERIPVRLAMPALLKVYSDAVESGDSSLAITFQMLKSLVGTMDRSSVSSYHGKIYELCLSALDLRRQHPVSVIDIVVVEKSVIDAMISLTMKLTELMFKPLFISTVDWAESHVDETSNEGGKSIDRSIALFGLVNKLAESHRSLFVPYFKILLEGCVRHLLDGSDATSGGSIRKKKKAKIQDAGADDIKDKNNELSLKRWHLRALVISALHKCFLYDTGNLKFLDSSNFQVLLKPIVSQLVIDPPTSLDDHPSIPSVEEVDEALVNCIGQMAVAAGTDLLWKPLNHEVLLQTRSEKVRSRILGLKIVKNLLENLKEEYLVFLPETIPFLGELLEDVELPVKSLAQDILKEMESMSGENLRQYLQ